MMIQLDELPDGELLRRMADGDEVAFRVIYRRCQGPIYRFALHMSGSGSIAEDVTQEVFVFLIQEAGRFDASRGTLTGYLFGIGRNLLLRRMEKERAFVPFPDSDAAGSGNNYGNGSSNVGGKGRRNGVNNGHGSYGSYGGNGIASRKNGNLANFSTPPLDIVRNEEIDRVRQAVLSLPPNYREAVVLCDLHELSYEEAAKVLECAVGTVRSRLHRGRGLLVEKLREFHNPRQYKSAAGAARKN
jgi:RNA polymerase sigma-70 factor (ECF subfamily)